MDKVIARNAFRHVGDESVLAASKEAAKKEKEGASVINATTGMLFDENHKLAEFPIVQEELAKHLDANGRGYPVVNGGHRFSDGVLKWVFEDNYEQVKSIGHHVVAAPGGTGALALAMRCYLNPGDRLLIPSLCWSNYESLASQVFAKPQDYSLFDQEGHFDVAGLLTKVRGRATAQKRVALVVNDPLENPTGYSLSLAEWNDLMTGLAEVAKTAPVVLILDIAYLNYAEPGSYSPVWKIILNTICQNMIVLVAFSASKTLSVYGLRGGACIALSKEQKDISDFALAAESTARAIWSCCNNDVLRTIGMLFNDEERSKKLRLDIEVYQRMLKKRGDLFVKLADQAGVPHFPFRGGFFITVRCEEPSWVAKSLAENNIYVVTYPYCVRVALSSINLTQIPPIVASLKKALGELK